MYKYREREMRGYIYIYIERLNINETHDITNNN